MLFLFVNPIVVSWFHKTSWRPSDFSAANLYSIRDDIPHQYATFVDVATEVQPPDGKNIDFIILESGPLEKHTLLCFYPKSFRFSTNSPEKYEIFFKEAYVAFEKSKTIRKARSLSEAEISFLITDPTPDCKVVMLLGVAADEELNSISPTEFQFITGEPNETKN